MIHHSFRYNNLSLADFTPPSVAITALQQEVPTAGDTYNMSCTVELFPDLPPRAMVERFWLDPHANRIKSDLNTTISEGMTNTTLITFLNFSRIRTSQAGQYSCSVSLTALTSMLVDFVVTATFNVTVKSKSIKRILHVHP